MGYTLTLDVPHDAVEFAEGQVARGDIDLSALFLAFLTERLGYRRAVAQVPRSRCEVGPLTKSLSGIVRLPAGIDDRDLLAHGMLEKYESLS